MCLPSTALTPVCQNGEVRLVDGSRPSEGRLEVCYNDFWTPVCDEGRWGSPEVHVICRQLGYPTEGQFLLELLQFCTLLVSYLHFLMNVLVHES